MNNIAIFPGSFDPFTIGHEDIINRALPLFDKIYIAIGSNSTKKYMFSLEQRTEWIKELFVNEKKIEVTNYSGLTIEYCKKTNAKYLLRGLRSAADFEYEKSIAHLNLEMNSEIETLFLITRSQYSSISSTLVREIILHNANASKFLPKGSNKNAWRIS